MPSTVPYRSLLTATFALAIHGCATAPHAAVSPRVSSLEQDVTYLTADALSGRETGTPGSDSAAAFIARRYESLGLSGAVPREDCHSTAPCGRTYFQFFRIEGSVTQNIVAVVPGSDSLLSGEYVVLGAHYDHLGHSTREAEDPQQLGLRVGADDNASGTAAVLALAQRFAAHHARRPIVVANFGAEELGLVGSRVFVEHPPVPVDSIVAMLNFDMVGRMRSGRVEIRGVGGAPALRAIVERANQSPRAGIVMVGSADLRSDHASFAARGVPILHFFTGYHADYHRVSDRAERLNYDGLLLIVDLAEEVARAIADREPRPCSTQGRRMTQAACALDGQ